MPSVVKKMIAMLLLIAVVPTLTWAQTGTGPLDVNKFDQSFNLGPVAVSLQMTKPIPTPSGMVWDTLHIEVRDDTQTPPFHATLDAVGQASDNATLLGGFLPATIIVRQDLLAGQTLTQAVADAQTKTGVTITSFQDASLAEYGLLLALIAVVCLAATTTISPTLKPQLSAVLAQTQTSLGGVGGSELAAMLAAVQPILTAINGSVIP